MGGDFFGRKTVTPDPTRDYIQDGPGRFNPEYPESLIQEFDDVTRNFGHKTYVDMLTDPAVSSQYLGLKLSTVSGAIRVSPKVRPQGYSDGPSFDPGDSAKVTPQAKQSIEVSEFLKRDICRPVASFKSILLRALDMWAFGNKLGEITLKECEFGPDKGKLGLDSLNIKPHWAWQFVVDSTMKPVGILTYVPPGLPGGGDSGYSVVPIEKFVTFTWLPIDNDPRGTSALRAAYDWWNLKRQVMPFYYQHLRRFGSPSLDVEMSPDDHQDRLPLDPYTGVEIANATPVKPEVRMMQALLAYQNNSVIVRPPGSKLTALEPTSNGESFLKAFDLFDRQICLAIALQTRVSLEAKHGSKADSETAQDTRGLVPTYASEELGKIVSRQLFYYLVKTNFGQDVAEEFTPDCVIGSTEKQDKPSMLSAVTSAGFQIGRSQWKGIDDALDLPERDMEADDAHSEQQAQKQADLAAKMAPPADSPGGKPAKSPVSGETDKKLAPNGGKK
jgi:hypothetical protein